MSKIIKNATYKSEISKLVGLFGGTREGCNEGLRRQAEPPGRDRSGIIENKLGEFSPNYRFPRGCAWLPERQNR